MSQPASSRTWRVTLYAALTPALSVGLLIFLLALAEITARSEFVRAHLPAPGVGSRSRHLEMQLDRLRTSAARRGGVDCIVFGNSLAFFGFDPTAFSAAYYQRSGQHIRCYNFGVLGLTASGVAPLARILADDYHPWLLMYAVNVRDLTWRGEDPAISSMPWVQYRQGVFSIDGWLTENSSAYRYYLMYRSWHEFEGARRVHYPMTFSPEGFLATDFNLQDRTAKLETFKSIASRALAPGVSPGQMSDLTRFLELGTDGRRTVMVEMPVHPSLKDALATTDIYTGTLKQMRAQARRHHALFLRRRSWQMIPDNGWADFWHLNAHGAEVFSRWLADRLASRGMLQPSASR